MDSNDTKDSVNLFPDLQIDSYLESQLKEIIRWAKFLSIIGFVFCGATLSLAIFEAVFAQRTGSSLIAFFGTGFIASVIYVTAAFLIFFPSLNLFRFSNKAKSALRNNNQEDINYSFMQLKSYFRFVGILTLVMIGFYGIIVVIAILGAFIQ